MLADAYSRSGRRGAQTSACRSSSQEDDAGDHPVSDRDQMAKDSATTAKGRLGPITSRAIRTRDDAAEHVDRMRTEHEILESAFQAGDLDRRRAGSLLAGGIAFRVFLWMLPASLLAAGLIGLVRPTGLAQPDHVARTLGLGASVTEIIRQATRQSDKGTAALVAAGLVLTLYMSMSLIRSLRVAFVLAWEEPFGRRPHVLRDGAIVSAALLGLLVVETGIAYLRHRVGVGASLLLSLVPVIVGGGAWLSISTLLPHADADWRALVPGASLFAVGLAVLHFATIFYFAPKLAREPALYGSLGTAAVLLVWLYLISRIVVASAFLSATLWRRSTPG
jgi:uncharacterized BrkB/YihY/UPF0761 family membrane protein